jgi:predicted phosphodiesterase
MRIPHCSDVHHGPKGHPACDETPGFFEAKARVEARTGCRVRVLGDGNELLQFSEAEIGELVHVDVDGNHDRRRGPRYVVIETQRGRTLETHGDLFDPWWAKAFGPPAARLARLLECIDPDADLKIIDLARRTFGLGRYGKWDDYKVRAAKFAARLGCDQVVFGHLHELHDEWVAVDCQFPPRYVHVVCTGCCCKTKKGYRMDFVEVDV